MTTGATPKQCILAQGSKTRLAIQARLWSKIIKKKRKKSFRFVFTSLLLCTGWNGVWYPPHVSAFAKKLMCQISIIMNNSVIQETAWLYLLFRPGRGVVLLLLFLGFLPRFVSWIHIENKRLLYVVHTVKPSEETLAVWGYLNNKFHLAIYSRSFLKCLLKWHSMKQ